MDRKKTWLIWINIGGALLLLGISAWLLGSSAFFARFSRLVEAEPTPPSLTTSFDSNQTSSASLSAILDQVKPVAVIEQVNQVRQNQGLPTLVTDSRLFKSSLAKANDLCHKGYFSHESPQGLDAWYWLGQSQVEYEAAGENLARNVTNLTELIETWSQSASHSANMLNPRFTQTGVAVKHCTLNNLPTIVVVQHFAILKNTSN